MNGLLKMASDPQFTFFLYLPPEVRIKIWKLALPDKYMVFEPQAFPFERGCWRINRNSTLTVQEDEPEPFVETFWEFDDALLTRPLCRVTLGGVNREARDVATSWVRSLGGEPNQAVDPTFMRPFVGCDDGLYVSAEQWEHFVNEPTMVPSVYYIRELCHITSKIKRLILPESVVTYASEHQLSDAFQFYEQVREIYIVPDESDEETGSGEHRPRIRGRLLMPKTGGYAVTWDPEVEEFFPECPMEEYVKGFLERLSAVLVGIPSLKVRSAVLGPHINDVL
ncbi:unnamed protein product [Clonostachys rosea]|uniref:2EXR domain-containing protein n=1 Tax=Bionectria ochroleuca TaxID=29856 RepID=A0ABY6UKX9_BIOOC|nr:unnamed protein product [Clonostachys rosea]